MSKNAERNSMLADDSEQDDIKEIIKEILYAPRDNHVTQSEVVDSLGHGNNLAKMIPMTDTNMSLYFLSSTDSSSWHSAGTWTRRSRRKRCTS